MSVFIDTSAFYANAVLEDKNHLKARQIIERLLKDTEELFTSNYVLLETLALFQKRHGVTNAEKHLLSVSGSSRVLWIGEAEHEKAWQMWRSNKLRDLSLVDCASFIVMKEHKIRRAFAFDEHFTRQGFELLN